MNEKMRPSHVTRDAQTKRDATAPVRVARPQSTDDTQLRVGEQQGCSGRRWGAGGAQAELRCHCGRQFSGFSRKETGSHVTQRPRPLVFNLGVGSSAHRTACKWARTFLIDRPCSHPDVLPHMGGKVTGNPPDSRTPVRAAEKRSVESEKLRGGPETLRGHTPCAPHSGPSGKSTAVETGRDQRVLGVGGGTRGEPGGLRVMTAGRDIITVDTCHHPLVQTHRARPQVDPGANHSLGVARRQRRLTDRDGRTSWWAGRRGGRGGRKTSALSQNCFKKLY